MRALIGPPAPASVDVEGVVFADTPAAGLRGESIPAADSAGFGLFFHGGAYIAGCAPLARPLFGSLCHAGRIDGWSVDYRLAPEHQCPAAFDDGVAAYAEVLRSGRRPESIVVCGESAGGGVALATLVGAREAGLPSPAGLLLWWPWVDLTLAGNSVKANAGKDVLTPELLALSAALYCGQMTSEDSRCSPLFADLHGLPPTLILVGSLDLLVDDSRRLVRGIVDAGGAAELREFEGLQHGWAMAGGATAESAAAIQLAADWIQERLASPARRF